MEKSSMVALKLDGPFQFIVKKVIKNLSQLNTLVCHNAVTVTVTKNNKTLRFNIPSAETQNLIGPLWFPVCACAIKTMEICFDGSVQCINVLYYGLYIFTTLR